MFDDEHYLRAVESINQSHIGKKIWNSIMFNPAKDYSFRNGRKVYFKLIGGYSIPFIYSYEYLLENPRFLVVDYRPEYKFVSLLQKILF